MLQLCAEGASKLEEIKNLIVNRFDINCVNEEGYTAFLLLVKQGQLGGFASSMENVQNTTDISHMSQIFHRNSRDVHHTK